MKKLQIAVIALSFYGAAVQASLSQEKITAMQNVAKLELALMMEPGLRTSIQSMQDQERCSIGMQQFVEKNNMKCNARAVEFDADVQAERKKLQKNRIMSLSAIAATGGAVAYFLTGRNMKVGIGAAATIGTMVGYLTRKK